MIENIQKTIALIQTSMSPNLEDNLKNIAKLIKTAVIQKAEIVCLPELFNTQYFAQIEDKQHFNLAESIPGPTCDFLQDMARKNKITLIGGSIFEKGENNHYYNTALIIGKNGQILGKYRKMHIPQDPNYYERYYFKQGDLGYIDVNMQGLHIAPLICYDQWFPEPARILALRGVHLICYPTAIGWFPKLQEGEPFSAQRWEQAMCAHASMNGIYVAACNRIGNEGDMNFWGGSFIADPFGQIIAQASSYKEEILMATISTERIFDSQEGWGFLKYRRPDSYKDLTKNL